MTTLIQFTLRHELRILLTSATLGAFAVLIAGGLA